MRSLKSISIIAAMAAFSVQIFAQQRIDPTLEVQRNFDARLLEITKGNLYTNFADSLGRFNLSFNYSIFDKPIKDLYDFNPLPSALLQTEKREEQPLFYLKTGANIPFNPYASLYIQPRLSDKVTLVFHADHNSFHSSLPAVKNDAYDNLSKGDLKTPAPSSDNKLGATLKYSWNQGETGIRAGFQNSMYSYYGFNQDIHDHISNNTIAPFLFNISKGFMKDSLSHTFNRLSATYFARSLKKSNNSFHYDTDISFSHINDKANFFHTFLTPVPETTTMSEWQTKLNNTTLSEKYLNVGLTAGAGFANHNRIMAGVRYEASNSYFSDSLDRSNLELYPRYQFRKGRWDFNIGIKYNMWWNKGESDFNIYLSGLAQFQVVQEKLWLYGLIDGRNNFMNYHKLVDINPWIHPNINIKNIEQPVIARAGIKGLLFNRFSFNVYGLYQEWRNQLFFSHHNSYITPENIPANSFNAYYDNDNRIGAGGEITFESQNFSGGARAEYYVFIAEKGYSLSKYNQPPLEIIAYGRYNWRERVIANIDFHYRMRSPALFEENLYGFDPGHKYNPSFTLINLELSYIHSKNMTLFVRVNNILNSQIIYFQGYSMPGINGGAGIALKF